MKYGTVPSVDDVATINFSLAEVRLLIEGGSYSRKCMCLYLHRKKTCANSEMHLTKNSYIKNAYAFVVSFKGRGQSIDRLRCYIPPRLKWCSLLKESAVAIVISTTSKRLEPLAS